MNFEFKCKQPPTKMSSETTFFQKFVDKILQKQQIPIADIRLQLQILWASFQNKYFKNSYFQTNISNYL